MYDKQSASTTQLEAPSYRYTKNSLKSKLSKQTNRNIYIAVITLTYNSLKERCHQMLNTEQLFLYAVVLGQTPTPPADMNNS